jgi:hypothetical protein
MSESEKKNQVMSKQPNGWGVPITRSICHICDWSFLIIGDSAKTTKLCPYCFQGELDLLESEQDLSSFHYSPELVIPPSMSESKINNGIEHFADKIPFPPNDLNPVKLRQRLQLFYLPVWLVDSRISAIWHAETGFDYKVVSHQEHFANGQWMTREVEETRVRWEPRAGRLKRKYENVSAPALQIHTEIWRRMGSYHIDQAKSYSPNYVLNTLVRMPDQDPDAVWPAVKPIIQKKAAAEVKDASNAEHIRSFRWAPSYQEKGWTLLLAPVYATFYNDDHGQPQPVLIHAQTGRVNGVRRSSMRSAQRLSLILAIIAFVVFVLSLVLGVVSIVIPPLLVIAIVGGVISTIIGVGAIVPMIRSWRFNIRHEKQKRVFTQ